MLHMALTKRKRLTHRVANELAQSLLYPTTSSPASEMLYIRNLELRVHVQHWETINTLHPTESP